MDVSAVYKGKKGSGTSKWKDKEAAVNPDAEVTCHLLQSQKVTGSETVGRWSRERCRAGTCLRSRCKLESSDNASTNQHD